MAQRFKDLAQRLIEVTFADVSQDITIQRVSGAYDDEAGVVDDIVTEVEVRGIVGPYSENQIDGVSILNGDIRMLIAVNSLSQPPALQNDLLIVDGVEYKVVGISLDAARAVWRIQLRIQ